MAAGATRGIRDVGIYAVESMRLDKCYRSWKQDLETGFTAFEAGLDRFVDLAKPDFVGKSALLAERERGVRQRLVPLILDEPGEADAPFCAPVHAGGERVGLVTSGFWSFTLEQSVALAYLRSDLAAPGSKVEVEIFGWPRPGDGRRRAALRPRERPAAGLSARPMPKPLRRSSGHRSALRAQRRAGRAGRRAVEHGRRAGEAGRDRGCDPDRALSLLVRDPGRRRVHRIPRCRSGPQHPGPRLERAVRRGVPRGRVRQLRHRADADHGRQRRLRAGDHALRRGPARPAGPWRAGASLDLAGHGAGGRGRGGRSPHPGLARAA